MKVISIINGPNLNLIGTREPDIYGNVGFEEYLLELKREFHDIEIRYFQSNIEGEIIDEIQKQGMDSECAGIVLNAGGYSHTSISIGDAVAGISVPVISVHLSNIYAREMERRTDLIAAKSKGMITGFGMRGYALAITELLHNIDSF
jgi:3-dehydroquinate dehydratase II